MYQCFLIACHFALADVTVKEIIALNHGIDPKNVEEKQTILIPGGKLSARDKEILAGDKKSPHPTGGWGQDCSSLELQCSARQQIS